MPSTNLTDFQSVYSFAITVIPFLRYCVPYYNFKNLLLLTSVTHIQFINLQCYSLHYSNCLSGEYEYKAIQTHNLLICKRFISLSTVSQNIPRVPVYLPFSSHFIPNSSHSLSCYSVSSQLSILLSPPLSQLP